MLFKVEVGFRKSELVLCTRKKRTNTSFANLEFIKFQYKGKKATFSQSNVNCPKQYVKKYPGGVQIDN